LINKEIDQGISPHRIVVGGFSQGCVMSLLTGLTSDHTLGGIIGCSGWLGQQHKFPNVSTQYTHI
jgi:predicted esterase